MSKPELKILREVVSGDQSGFKLVIGYSVELKHGLMGYFPAIFCSDEERQVVCLDREMMRQVCELLPPRRLTVNETLFYAHTKSGLAFPVGNKHCLDAELETEPIQALSQTEFAEITADGAKPFKWAPGLVGDDMSRQEFTETLQHALAGAP